MEYYQTDQNASLDDLKRQLEETYKEYLSIPIGRYEAALMAKITKLEDELEELERLL